MYRYAILFVAAFALSCASSPDAKTDQPVEETASAVAPATASDADVVETKFAWPDQLEGTLHIRETDSVKVNGQQLSGNNLKGEFLFTAEKTESGHALRFVHPDVLDMPTATDEDKQKREVAAWNAMWVPSFSVGPDGKYQGLLDPERIKRIGALGNQAMVDESEDKAAMREVMKGFDPVASMRSLGQSRWQTWVGAWRDQTFEVGNTEPDAALRDMVEQFGILERTKCTDQAAEASCVAFVVERKLQPREFGDLALMMKNAMGGDAEVEVISATKKSAVVSDPDTLVPYRVESTTDIQMKLTGSREATVESNGVSVVIFDYSQ